MAAPTHHLELVVVREDALLVLRESGRSRRPPLGVPAPRARAVTGRAPLVDVVAYYSGLAPWAVVLLLGMLLLIAGCYLLWGRR
jgi:hypothetical protein